MHPSSNTLPRESQEGQRKRGARQRFISWMSQERGIASDSSDKQMYP